MDDISGFVDEIKSPLKITHISCGKKHALAAFEYGAFYVWGDNEYGQLGNRKRNIIESPFPIAKFELKHNVLNICTDHDNIAVIVERLPEKI